MCDIGEDGNIPLISRSAQPLYFDDVLPELPNERDVSIRLEQRKKLLIRRRHIVNTEFALVMIGIIAMLVNTELYIQNVSVKRHKALFFIVRFLMSSSTALLLLAIYFYHNTQVKLMKLNKNVNDWRMVVTRTFVFIVCCEFLICAVHPFPGNLIMPFQTIDGHTKYVTTDSVLSILMILRLYIVVRFIVVHNKWILSTSMLSFGALNEIEVGTDFFMKCLMRDHPAILVVSIMLTIFVVNSWAMRTCESYFVPDNEQSNAYNSMWLVAITFLTVGYGDLAPNSYCGRVIAAETGVMGVAITALLVTVITSKFKQTRSERYVHAFMWRVKLEKKKKDAAARVITTAMVQWYLKQHDLLTVKRVAVLKRKLQRAAKSMKNVDRRLVAITDNALGLVEISSETDLIFNVVEAMQAQVSILLNKNTHIDSFLSQIDDDLSAIQSAVVK